MAFDRQPEGFTRRKRVAGLPSLVLKLYTADPLGFTIDMKLEAHEVPEMRLSSDDEAMRLGFTSWVRTGEMPPTSVKFASTSGIGLEPATLKVPAGVQEGYEASTV